jgi:hypothetical protein
MPPIFRRQIFRLPSPAIADGIYREAPLQAQRRIVRQTRFLPESHHQPRSFDQPRERLPVMGEA